MRLSLQKAKGSWRLSAMEEIHVQLLNQAAGDASERESAAGRARFLASPLNEEDAVLEEEFLEDWQEFVAPDLHEKFTNEASVFQRDLQAIETYRVGTNRERELFRVTLPLAHGFDWFSALNQARIMLDLRYKFHDEADEFVAELPPEVLGEMDPQERLAAYLRYDFYCMIQEWIVRNVLSE